jgi:hypothetical protein
MIGRVVPLAHPMPPWLKIPPRVHLEHRKSRASLSCLIGTQQENLISLAVGLQIQI